MTPGPADPEARVDGPVLALEQVSKVHQGGSPVRALDGVDLTLHPGELLGVLGPSGSGKSTLLAILGLLDRPTTGRVLLDGVDVAGLTDRQLAGLRATAIGFVFQRFHLAEARTALDNVADGALYQGVPRRVRRRTAEDLLRRVGLGGRLHHRASRLSGGERQRVGIARALMGDPRIVLADEPTGNLDRRAAAEVLELLDEVRGDGRAVVVVTHDPEVAARCTRTVRLVDGRLAVEAEVRP